MTRLSIAPRARDDAGVAAVAERFSRRVRTVPPGTCPLAFELSFLQASAAQTCGKCVPCRDGLPQLAAMLSRVVSCEANEGDVARMRALAEMVRDTSDCAIGYEAAGALLDGLAAFSDELESHLTAGRCQKEVGQTVPCETL